MDTLQGEWKISTRRACAVLRIDHSLYVYKSKRGTQAELTKAIKNICETRVCYGYRRVHVLSRRDGWSVDSKRVYRLYKELGLQLRNKVPERWVKAKMREDRHSAAHNSDTWAMNFVHDQLATGRKIRARSSSAGIWICGRSRNGSCSTSPDQGKPTDNSFIESFNGKFRAECLNMHWFMSLDDARAKMEVGRQDYNEVRPHSAIGNKPPISLLNDLPACLLVEP